MSEYYQLPVPPPSGITAQIHARHLIEEAMKSLAQMPIGGIGKDGVTLEDIDETEKKGKVIIDDATYHQSQKAWRLLEKAQEILMKSYEYHGKLKPCKTE